MRSGYVILIFNILGCSAISQTTTITSVTPVSTTVGQYEKFETTVVLTGVFNNSYDYDQVHLKAIFTGPNGDTKTVDGFFMQDYSLNTTNGNLTASGAGKFKIRFAPDKPGTWRYIVSLTTTSGNDNFAEQTFECIPSSEKGFVRKDLSHYLHFDDGDQYIPVGENMAWQNGNAYTSYNTWLNELADHGGNYIRLWHAHWGLGIEWKANQDNFLGLRKYKETNCFYQDWLFDLCADRGIYVMLCIQHHGQVATNVNPNWNESPYNATNGGPCANTWDFFTNATAKAHTKNRIRYIVARWGYARSVMCWELFNEVVWTDQFDARKSDIAAWHHEMATFIKDIDPYHHLITTSYGGELDDPEVWSDTAIDFTQTHIYLNSSNIEKALAGAERAHLNAFQKPTLVGEFGLGGNSDLANEDPDGIHIHNSLWGSLFGGGLGTGMTWWWDNYIHPKDLYYHFQPVTEVADVIPFVKKNFSPGPAHITGAPGDLVITPSLGWSGIGTASITIDNGQVQPEGAALGYFLYGSVWNTQFRSPPVFIVNYPAAGTFTVKTNNETGTEPVMTIYLDGAVMHQGEAATNTSYSIAVPAGQHTIKVDNTGTDWISIDSYIFSGLGSKIDAYVLNSSTADASAGWVLNSQYNHNYIATEGIPPVVNNAMLHLEQLADATYQIQWFDCITGLVTSTQQVIVSGGHADISIPTLQWDAAFLLTKEGEVNTTEIKYSLPFDIYPNPINAGTTLNINLEKQASENDITVYLLDVSGKEILSQNILDNKKGLKIPDHLTPGMYWIKIRNGQKSGTKSFVLFNRK